MATHRRPRWTFSALVRSLFAPKRPRPIVRRRLGVEQLEDRLAPAVFTGAGPNLAIDLNSANEMATFSTNGTTVTVNLTNARPTPLPPAATSRATGRQLPRFFPSGRDSVY